jgi:hypothetical protein
VSFGVALARLNQAVLRTFAEASVVRAGHPAFTGIFDHGTIAEDVLADMPGEVRGLFSGPVPVLTAADADITDLAYGDALTVNGVAYTVREMQPDGVGMTRILLKKL